MAAILRSGICCMVGDVIVDIKCLCTRLLFQLSVIKPVYHCYRISFGVEWYRTNIKSHSAVYTSHV
jgi:hypothetical protein